MLAGDGKNIRFSRSEIRLSNVSMIFRNFSPFRMSLSICVIAGGHLKEASHLNASITVALLSTYPSMQTLWPKRRVLKFLKGLKIFAPRFLKWFEPRLMYCSKGVLTNKSPSSDSNWLLNKISACKLRNGTRSLLETCARPALEMLNTVKFGKNRSRLVGMPFSNSWFERAIAKTLELLLPAVWLPLTSVTLRSSPTNWNVPVHV